jgi:hypothetical protein
LRLHKWLVEDIVHEQHLIHAAYCPFMLNPENTDIEKLIRKLKSSEIQNGN